MNTDIDILLARYFSGEASGKDMELLEKWLAESEENEAYFEKMTIIFEKSAMVETPAFNKQKAFNDFKNYINNNTSEKKHKTKYKTLFIYTAIAAVSLLVIGLFYSRYFTNDYINNNAVTITADKFTRHTMPSGALVSLDSLSTISYELENNTYMVTLEGKANFKITDGNSDFIVIADNVFIKDIGTVFTVTAYPDNDNITVDVESGTVHFYTKTDNGLILNENTKAVYHKSKKKFELINETDEAVIFDFNEVTLNEVISVISAHFNVNIKLTDESAGALLITTYFENESIDDIMTVVAETLSLKLTNEQGTYILSK